MNTNIFTISDASAYCPSVRNKAESTFIFGNSCYNLVQNPDSSTTRDFARSDCQSRNGDLLTIKNEKTQNMVMKAVDQMSDSHTILLGLKREGKQWKWVDGEVITYNNWTVTTQPQLGNCGRLNVMEAGRWERIDCAAPDWFTVYICEHNDRTTGAGNGVSSKYSFFSLASMVVSLLIVCFAHS